MWEVGDRVQIKDHIHKSYMGIEGTIVLMEEVNKSTYHALVVFDDPMGGHNGDESGRYKDGRCWYFFITEAEMKSNECSMGTISIEKIKSKKK